METFVLIPGAGGDASYWSRLVPELESRGHAAIAVDIREDDPALGLPEYADITLAAIGGCTDTVLVAQSMGAFTAAMVASRVPVRAIVLLTRWSRSRVRHPASHGTRWGGSRHDRRRRGQGLSAGVDTDTYFLHDVPAEVLASLPVDQRGPSDTPFGQPCTFESWPDVPLRVLAGADDRFFPLDLQRRLAGQRLGVEVDVLPGGHLLALGHAAESPDRLTTYAAGLPRAHR